MKTRMNFWLLALMICTFVSCADNANFEPEEQAQEREQLREKLSHEVTQAEARVKLEKMLPNLKLPSTRGGVTNSLPPITSVYTTGKAAVATRAGEEVEPYFHIFNFGDNEGFAIMSGDDRVEPLLALTFKGELSPETEIDNPGFEIAYSRMEEYYVQKVSEESLDESSILPPTIDPIPSPTFDTTVICSPVLCPVKWGQLDPYNSVICYIREQDSITVGCEAVAIAQLMAVYKYPNSYFYNTATFNWDDMTNQSPSAEGEGQISILMYLLGNTSNLDMTYATVLNGGSSSDSDNVHRTLRNFGYLDGTRCIDYDNDSVMIELASSYPVLLRGETANRKGHMWLAHGSMRIVVTPIYPDTYPGIIHQLPMTTDYILCNWGWYGDEDGYYLSGMFYTDYGPRYPEENITRYHFQNNVEAFINIRKPY